MVRKDTCIVFRTVITITPPYNTPVSTQVTFPTDGSYKCHLCKQTGVFVQGQPNAIITIKFKLILDFGVNIQKGDIIQVNNASKYIVENVYCPLNKHMEVDLTIKGES